ncbi:phytoene desaturase family protein [Aestuariivirga litoralis]|uniref:phytoene desaturase family protein n=1 Tax=Aestuariivirga litoralis TaxID=2650924 RepID=UPI0018C7801F|nr:NAD(P)/FAD-dependent oxidoreductase [Aestuariivirga litoralis]MBG1230768.1 NAD(P)/FAD-dependent oxidoreductase [Aestuariivirga litoralis]
MPSFDAIIIGGGINGLAAAGKLAKGGQSVLLLEQRLVLGGGADMRSFAKGYQVSGLAHLINVLDSRVEKELELAKHGLSYVESNVATTALSASGDHLLFGGAFGEQLEGDVSVAESRAWLELRARLLAHAATLKPFKQMVPPRLQAKAGNDMLALGKLALGLRLRGREALQDFLRLLLINVFDVLEDELSDDRLKGLIAHDAVMGAFMGPRSPNSLLLLLNRLSGDVRGKAGALALPQGGMASVAQSMAKAIVALGVKTRVDATVSSIIVEGDKAIGVILKSGERIEARRVISAINPQTTFMHLVGPRQLDVGFVRQAQSIRMRGTVAKLHLALSGAPNFREANLRTRLVIAPSARAVENQFNPVKYNQFSPEPVMEMVLPSAFEDGYAPAGHHVLSANVQFAPTSPEGGWAKAKPAFLKAIMKQLEHYAPGISKQVVATELLTPEDIEREYGLVGGNWHHGELAVERMMFLRPFAGVAQYETPISGLYLAGAGSHPGGGISGAAGWSAATKILKGGRA